MRKMIPRHIKEGCAGNWRIPKPYSPPDDPLTAPGMPSERQGQAADDGAGELSSSLDSWPNWGWISPNVPICSVIRGLESIKDL